MILAGQVVVHEPKAKSSTDFTPRSLPVKPGTLIFENCRIEIKSPLKYVSRGGEKLESALRHWKINVKDKICLDVGSSTGGFVDCLLQSGAKKVWALDVGHGQLHPSIRNDPRVIVLEKTHILKWDPPWKESDQIPSLLTIDVSFISLTGVLTKVVQIFNTCIGSFGVEIIALIKPQFEVGQKFLKKGIVKDAQSRSSAIEKVKRHASETGLEVLGHFPCPVIGAKGNQEEWLYCRKGN